MKFSTSYNIKMTGILLVVGILIEVLYDPISSAKHSLNIMGLQKQLPLARAQWEALGIRDYTFEIEGNGRSICEPSAVIEVRNDAVVRVQTKDAPARSLPPEKWSDPGWGDEVFLCNYNHFTMTRFFDLVDNTLQDFPSSILQADFDPQYGFLTDFNFGIYVGYGLLRPQISDCCNIFRIRNFKPIK
jgi:hypothetical protein